MTFPPVVFFPNNLLDAADEVPVSRLYGVRLMSKPRSEKTMSWLEGSRFGAPVEVSAAVVVAASLVALWTMLFNF